MILDSLANFTSRLVRDSTAHNTLDSRTIEVFFHKSPSWAESDTRGIGEMDYEIVADGIVVRSGTTEDDGRIEVPVTGGQAELRLTFQGNEVATYQFNVRDDALEGDTTIPGIQRRLRILGYHLGHAGAGQDGIDGDLGGKSDKAILDFQIDNQLAIDGVVGANTRTTLNDIVGGSAEP
jgi:Putative peptidoglycan binding domain